jgi:hypothetical protein
VSRVERWPHWHGLARAVTTAGVVVLVGAVFLPGAAGAEATGSIAGKVTGSAANPQTVSWKVCAISISGGESCALAQSNGEYTISGLESGEYKVSFAAVCLVEQCDVTYVSQYYDDQFSLAKAVPIQVSAPVVTTGIDAIMETEGEMQGREYLENEVLAEPTGNATSTLPTAIEPLPVNKQLEEEFWAHPPWGKSTTPGSSAGVETPVVGVAVAANFATVRYDTAKIILHCVGAGACRGSVKIVAGRLTAKHLLNVGLGETGFSLPQGAAETLGVHLTHMGQALFREADRQMLKVKLTGIGVKSGALILK